MVSRDNDNSTTGKTDKKDSQVVPSPTKAPSAKVLTPSQAPTLPQKASQTPSQIPTLLSKQATSTPSQMPTDYYHSSRSDAFQQILYAISGKEVLNDTTSYQFEAFEWLLYDDKFIPFQQPETEKDIEQIITRYILAVFYFATSRDQEWDTRINFLSVDMDVCTWRGVIGTTMPSDAGVICTADDKPFSLLIRTFSQPLSFCFCFVFT